MQLKGEKKQLKTGLGGYLNKNNNERDVRPMTLTGNCRQSLLFKECYDKKKKTYK